jgi:hypothetical protein
MDSLNVLIYIFCEMSNNTYHANVCWLYEQIRGYVFKFGEVNSKTLVLLII